MSIRRPCLACGGLNAPDATRCASCDAELTAWSERATPAPLPSLATPIRRGRAVALAALALVLLVAVGWGVVRLLALAEPEAEGRGWADPATMAAWAATDLGARGVAPTSTQALVEERLTTRRRLVVSDHPPDQALATVVRKGARWLLAARAAGPATATDLLVVRQGDVAVGVPVGEASRLAESRDEVAAWLGVAIEDVPVEAEDEAAVAPVEPAADAPSESAEVEAAATDAVAPDADPGSAVGPVPAPTGDPASPGAAPVDGEGPPAATGAVTVPAPTVPAAPAPPGATAPVASAPAGQPAPAATAPAPARSAGAGEGAPSARRRPPQLLRGGGHVLPPKVPPGQAGVVLLRAQAHPGGVAETVLRAVTVRARGTLNDVEDIEWLRLIRDTDSDGRPGPSDPELGRGSFTDPDGTVTFDGLEARFGANGQPMQILVTADVAATLEGGTIVLSVPNANGVVMEDGPSGDPLTPTGLPLTGTTFTFLGNVQPDAEQERLDELAGSPDDRDADGGP